MAHYDLSVGTMNGFRFTTQLKKDSVSYSKKQFALFSLSAANQCSVVGASYEKTSSDSPSASLSTTGTLFLEHDRSSRYDVGDYTHNFVHHQAKAF